jgi:glutamyl endopeptidase
MTTRKTTKKTTRKRPAAKKQATNQELKLPRRPKGGFKDIGFLSFDEEVMPREKPSIATEVFGIADNPSDRQRAVDTRVSPFRKVCDLIITAADGTLHSGTAWFITPRMLLTCGHCLFVFSPGTSTHGLIQKVLVMPARNGETEPSESLVGWVEVVQADLRVHERWQAEKNLDFDYGVIILPPDKPLGAQVGVFLVDKFPDQFLGQARPTISGYPDDVPDGTQWFETNRITEVDPAHLFYDIFTMPGQSGSPLFLTINNQQVACAIHNFGAVPFNRGVRITQDVLNQLNAWRV